MKPEFPVCLGGRVLGGGLFFLSFQIPIVAANHFLNRVLFVAGRFCNFPSYVGEFASIKGESVLPFIKRFPHFFGGPPFIGAAGNGEHQFRPDCYLASAADSAAPEAGAPVDEDGVDGGHEIAGVLVDFRADEGDVWNVLSLRAAGLFAGGFPSALCTCFHDQR